MKILFIMFPALPDFRAVFNKKIQGLSSIGCFFILVTVFLNYPQSIMAQIRPIKKQVDKVTQQTNSITREFNIRGNNREIVEFELTNAGVIVAKAEWSGTAQKMALILNGPGRAQYYARKDGKSPMVLRYKVSENILSLGKTWKISVVNFGSGTNAHGNVQVNYPGAAVTIQPVKQKVVMNKKPVIKPVEKSKSMRVKYYEVQASEGFTAQQLQEIKVELEAQKIEQTKAKIESRIKEIGPDNPLAGIVIPLMYNRLEEKIQKPLMKDGINTSPYFTSLIQSYKNLSPSVTEEYFHPRYAELQPGQKIDKSQLGKDILEAIRPGYKSEIRQMVSKSISADTPKFQWNAAGVQKKEPPKVERIQGQPDQKRIRELETLTNKLKINPTQDNFDELKAYVQAQGFSLAEPGENHIHDIIAEKIGVQDMKDWIPDLNNDHFVSDYYKYDIGLDWFYCVDQNERTCIWIPFLGTECSDDEPYWHLSSIVPNYDPNDPDHIHQLHEGKLYTVFNRVTGTYDDVNNGETRKFRSRDRWLINNNIFNTSTTFTIGLWEEDWSKDEVRDAIQQATNDLRDELINTIQVAVMDAVKEGLSESIMEALPDELKGDFQSFLNDEISYESFMESVQNVMGGVDIGMIVLQMIFSGESLLEIAALLGGACPGLAEMIHVIRVLGPVAIDLLEGDFQDALKGLIYLPITLFEYIFDLFTNIVGFFENLMTVIDPDDHIQGRSITIKGSFDNIFEDAQWGDKYTGITHLTPRGHGPRKGNSDLKLAGRYVQPYLIFKGADAEYHAYYNVKRTIVGGRETFGFTTGADPARTYIQTRTYTSKSHSREQRIKVSYCTLNKNGSLLINLTEKNGRAGGSNLGTPEPEFYVNSIPGAEYELTIIDLFGKDLNGYVTLEEEW
ncbi:MAG TPA: hypothetical protein ENH59_00630 [Bacteroidetes bacterium]|nr:hypothetical protein [Bacteroidota bacterium]